MDTNFDGAQEAGEPGAAGAVVYLDTNGDGRFESTEPHTTTDATAITSSPTCGLATIQSGWFGPMAGPSTLPPG